MHSSLSQEALYDYHVNTIAKIRDFYFFFRRVLMPDHAMGHVFEPLRPIINIFWNANCEKYCALSGLVFHPGHHEC